jgi:hypothetical protein
MRVDPAAVGSVLAAMLFAACGGAEPPADEQERDLSLPPAESVAVLSDEPVVEESSQPIANRPASRQERESRPAPTPSQPPPQRDESPEPEPAPEPLSLARGTVLELLAVDTISSRMSVVGDRVMATCSSEILDANGRIVIPAGAVFTGEVTEIEPAGSPGGVGTLVLAFTQVHFGGGSYPIAAQSDSLGFEMKGQGVSGGDAAKVGAGAVVGAVAGRVVGKNTKGAVIGGVVGAAAGAAVAAATKDQDIILPAGGYIRVVLREPLVVESGT